MVVLLSTAMKGSGGSENVAGAVGEASRTTNGGRNGCDDDYPVIGTPFIWRRWCMVAHLGIKSGCAGSASMRYDSLRLPGLSECKQWTRESLGSSRLEVEARRTWWRGRWETVMSLCIAVAYVTGISELTQ
jgi:hypothetical protein